MGEQIPNLPSIVSSLMFCVECQKQLEPWEVYQRLVRTRLVWPLCQADYERLSAEETEE